MIEEYIKMFASFKDQQISKLTEYAQNIELPHIKEYIQYLEQMSPAKIEEKIKLLESFKHNQISKFIEQRSNNIFEILNSEHVSKLIRPYFEKINTTGVPFTDFALDPDNISQIKKLINALYYARLTFLDLEKVDIRTLSRSYADLGLLWTNTINQAYQATYLMTHLDVDLKNMFNDEISILLPILNQVQNFAENHAEETKGLADKLKAMPLSYQAGEITGVAVDQMRPLGGDVDYNFLTQFSAILPRYLNQLTEYIEQYSSQIKENEPRLNQEKLAELQNAALNLINDIEKLKGNSVFVSLKFLNYIHIIRHIITLSMSSLEQIGELSESSQDLVIDQLTQLKYDVLPTLFGLVDKIEDNAMLKAGTLSIPLMEKVKGLYKALLYLPSKAIDFKAKAEQLLSIEDSHFIELRLELTYKRIDAANKALFKAQKAQEALDLFFALLNEEPYNNASLSKLPQEIKDQLIIHYKIIRPYVIKLDIDLDKQIVDSLNGTAVESWSAYVGKPFRWITKQLPADHMSVFLKQQEHLQILISKDENSQLFHINLNKDLIASVHQKADLALFPYNEKTSVYAIDERIPLHITPDTNTKLILTKTEFQNIHNAHTQFMNLIRDKIKAGPKDGPLHFNDLDRHTKNQCLNLYTIFQPYLIHIMPAEHKDAATNLDKYLTALFTNKNTTETDLPTIKKFIVINKYFQTYCKQLNNQWRAQDDDAYYDLNRTQFLNEEEITALHDEENKKLRFIEKDGHNLLATTELLNTEQTLEIRQWYLNKHNKFLVMQNAYISFIQLLRSQIAERPELLNNMLLLNDLESEVKDKCRELYNIFQPYFIDAVPDVQKAAALHFDNYLVSILSNRPIDPRHAPSLNSLLSLDEHLEDQFSAIRLEWQNKSQFYYRLAQKKFITEHQATELKQEAWGERAHFLVPQLECGLIRTLVDPDTLSKAELRKLLNYKTAYILFDTKIYYISADLTKTEISAANTEQIKDIFPEQTNLYQVALTKDLAKIKSLTGHAHHSMYSQCVHEFRKALFEITTGSCGLIKMSADPQTLSDDELKKLLKNKSAYVLFNTTIYYIDRDCVKTEIPTTNFEQLKALFIGRSNELREASPQSLTQITSLTNHTINTLFNKAMQIELVPQPSGLPFPEMEGQFTVLTQSTQVRAIKEIHNSLFHVEGIVLELEKLTNKNYHTEDQVPVLEELTKTGAFKEIYNRMFHGEGIVVETGKLNNKIHKAVYVYRLLQAYSHINEIIKLSKRLAEDPHFGIIARDLISKAQFLYATFQEHSDAYQVAHADVPYEGEIHYNPLWYTLNAFYISPKHIRSLKNDNYLTTEELNDLHLSAKKAALIIEKLIKSSDSYFKLFLQTPNMIFLYRELTHKLNEFTSTTHDAVLDNVGKIRSTVFTPMILEADHWEDKLGLAPGSLSGPLKKVTDEYFKGLLHPLGLHSQKHLALVCDKEPLNQRTRIIQKQIIKTTKYTQKLERNYKLIENLYERLQRYKNAPITTTMNGGMPGAFIQATPEESAAQKDNLRIAYKKALTKLVRLKLDNKINIEASRYDEDHQFDELCNTGLKEDDYKFTEVEAWITASHHYYLGLQKTSQMKLSTLKEKLTYLEQLNVTQNNENQAFVDAYTTQSFQKYLDLLCYRPVGLQFMDKEYSAELQKYLLTFKKDIILKSKTAADINQNVQQLLKEKISIFEKKHYLEYYHMDTIRVALARFKDYLNGANIDALNNRHLFENERTVNEKTQRVSELDEIAENNQLIIRQVKIQTDEIFANAVLTNDECLQQVRARVNEIAENNQLIINKCLQRLKARVSDIAKNKELSVKDRLQQIRLVIDETSKNNQLTLTERFQQINALVQEPSFSRIILSHKQTNTFSFTYLKLCFLSLLEALHLYTPARKKLFNNLNEAINKKPEMDVLTKRLGLFSATVAAPETPVTGIDEIPSGTAPVM